MIVTVTANPSFDRTIDLTAPLQRGQVQRAARSTQEPGGKGVNVSRALHAAGCPTLALLPGASDDPLVLALHAAGIAVESVPVASPVRSNTTVTEPDGTTTKLNEPGEPLGDAVTDALLALIVQRSVAASWLVLAGSLPPGVSDDFYARIAAAVQTEAARAGRAAPAIAVDSSGAPLAAAVASGASIALIKPNGEELLELAAAAGIAVPAPALGSDDFEADDDAVVAVAEELLGLAPALGAVLVTLGSRGALLVGRDEVLTARAPVIVARSTVGAGDCSLAGYLLAAERGDGPSGRLAQAVAHGAAAASLPGSRVPALELTHPDEILVSQRPRIAAGRR